MAIALRGVVTATSTAGASVTLPLSSIAGLAPNDVVVIFSCESYTSGAPDPVVSSSGWTDILGKGLNGSNTLATRVQFKRMGATPDTSAVVAGSGVAGNGVAALAIAFSGVNTYGQIFGGPSAAVAGNSTTPTAPALSSVTTDGTVVILAGMAPVTSPSTKGVSGFTSPTPNVADAAAGRPATIDIAYLLGFSATTGSYSPPAFAAFSATATQWAAFTISLQPDRTAAVSGVPSPTGAYLYYTDQTHYLNDYQGNRWWCASDAATIANGNWVGGGGAYSILIDWQGHTWVNNHNYSNPPSNWYYWDYVGSQWLNKPTGPISQTGTIIQVGNQYGALVDDNGDVWTVNRLNSGSYYYIDKNGTGAAGGSCDLYIEFADSPAGGRTIWASATGQWYYWNGSSWVATNPPNLKFPSATGITVGSPGIVDPGGPKAFAATEIHNQVNTAVGSYVAFGDTQHCLTHTSAPGNQYWVDASGKMWLNGLSTSGVTFAAGDVLQCAPTGNSVGSYIWARISGAWYYLYGAAYTFYPWNAGPLPQATSAPVIPFPTLASITTGSPTIGAPDLRAYTPLGGGSKTQASQQGTLLLFGDTTHCLYDRAGHLWAVNAAGNIFADGGNAVYGGSIGPPSDFIEVDYLGNMWAWSGGNWYSGPPATGWTAQATLRPQLTIPTATGITAASPAFIATALKAISNFTIPALSVGSPAFTPATFNAISILAPPVVLSVGSPAFTVPVLVQWVALAAPSLATSALAIGAAKGGYNFAQAAFAVGSPSFAPQTFVQNYIFAAAVPLTVGSPAFTPSIWGVVFAAPPVLAVGSPQIGSPSLVRVLAAVASNLTVGSPGLDAPVPGSNIGAFSFVAGSPAFSAPIFNQSASLAAAFAMGSPAFSIPVAYRWAPITLAVGSPLFLAPAINQTQVLPISDWTLTGPNIDGTAPNMSGATSIGAVDLLLGRPAFPAVALSQRHGLAAVVPSVAGLAFDVPVLGVIIGCASNPLVTASPVINVPALVRVVALTALDLWASFPAIDKPSLSLTAGGDAVSLTVQSPEFGAPALTLFDNLAEASFAPAGPAFDAPDLGVIVRASAAGLAVASPAIGRPLATAIAAGAPVPLTVAAPALGGPALGLLAVPLDASPGLSVGTPTLGAPTAAGKAVLAAGSLALGRPALGAPTLRALADADAANLVLGSPTLGAPTLSETVALDAADLINAPPAFERLWLDPTLEERHRFITGGLTIGRIEIGLASIGQTYSLVARGVTVKSPDQYWATLPVPVSLSIGSPVLGAPYLLQLTIRPAPVHIIGVLQHPGIIGIDDPVSDMSSSSDATKDVTGKLPTTKKVIGQRASAQITGVGEFTKIKS